MKTITSPLAAGLLLLPFGADAQSYRCVGKGGKKYYGQSLPPQCLGQPAEQLNAQGVVIKRIDPQASFFARYDDDRKRYDELTKGTNKRQSWSPPEH